MIRFAQRALRAGPAVGCALVLAGMTVAGCDVQVGDKGLSFGIAQGKATEEWVRTYTLPPGGHVDIANVNGAITLEPATSPQIEVRAVREARAASDSAAKELLAEWKMVEDVGPDHVKILVQHAGSDSFSLRRSVTVRYTIHLPPGLVVSARTQNGGVQLDDVRGTIAAATTNGGITGRNLAGGITASTVNGGVQLALADVTGPIEATAVNGGIRIEVPPGVNAKLEASVVNGGVSVDDALKLTAAEQDRRHVSGTLNAGGPMISAQTTNGGVRIYSSGRELHALGGR